MNHKQWKGYKMYVYADHLLAELDELHKIITVPAKAFKLAKETTEDTYPGMTISEVADLLIELAKA